MREVKPSTHCVSVSGASSSRRERKLKKLRRWRVQRMVLGVGAFRCEKSLRRGDLFVMGHRSY